jgi:hypothetical protein
MVEEIKKGSEEVPQRIVIDEVLEDGWYRIVSTKMGSPGAEADFSRESAWSREEDGIVNEKRLEKLLSKDQMEKIREGQVFHIEKGKAENVHEDVRKHVKARVKRVLDWEGKPQRGKKGRR